MNFVATERAWVASMLRVIFLTCFFSAWAQLAFGSGESIEVEYGFKGCVKDNRWFPVYLKPVPGIDQFDVTFIKADYSGKNPRPLVVFSGNFPSNLQGRGLAFCKELFESYSETRVQCGFLNAKGERVFKETILHPIQGNDRVVLVVTDIPQQFNFLFGLYLKDTGIVRVIACTAKEFPILWQELDCVDALILDQTKEVFSPSQFEALQNWLVAGGTVYLNAFAQEGARLFPEAKFSGQPTNCAPEVLLPFLWDKTAALETMPGHPIQVDRRFAILADGDKIFVAGKDAGWGRILANGLDWRNPVLKDRSAIEALQRNLWRTLLSLQRPIEHLQPGTGTVLPREVKPKFLVKPLAFYLLAYVLLVGPINWIVLRRFKKLDLLIIIIPLEAVLFAALALAIGISLRTREPVLYEAETLLLDQVANHVVSGLSGLLTPDERPYTLALPDSNARMEEIDDRLRWRYSSKPPAPRDLLTYGYAAGPFLNNLRIDTWAMRFFKTLTTAKLVGGIDAIATCDQDGLRVQVCNRLPFTIHDAHLIQRWNRAPIGDITTGVTNEFSMKLRPASKLPGRICPNCHSTHGKSSWFSEEFCEEFPLDQKLREFLEHVHLDFATPIIVGWQEVAGSTVQIDRPKYFSQRRRLCVIPVELQFAANEILIPEGIVTDVRVASNEVAFSTKRLREAPYRLETIVHDHAARLKSEERIGRDDGQPEQHAVSENVEKIFFRDYYLPFYAQGLETTALRVHWCGETGEDNLQEALILAIFDWKNQTWVDLARISDGEGTKTISDPGRFVFGNYPVVRLKTTSTEPEPKRRSAFLFFLEIAYEGRRIK